MNENEVEAREIFLPACLASAKLLRMFEIGKVLVIGEDSEWVRSTFEIVAPFLKGVDYCKKFTIINIVVAFGIVK